GYAEFLGLAPAVGSPSLSVGQNLPCVTAGNCPFAGGNSNPLNYPAATVTFGNGQGFSSELPAFGLPGGGLGPDNRIAFYFGDAWKLKPNFTLTYGLRYVRDTGRTDSDLGPIAALDQFNNQFYRNLGARVNQPNLNFAPQLGFAWDTSHKGTTVIRGGIGLFYENSIWNNNLFDRPGRLPSGLFLAQQPACSGGAGSFSFCGKPIGSVSSDIVAAQQAYQAASRSAASNPVYIGTALEDAIDGTGTQLFAPNYVTPRSVQMNIGIQHQIRQGMVLTVDYLRNVATHNLLTLDTNHVGDARYFHPAVASAAIATVEANCNLGTTVASTYSGPCLKDPSTGTNDGGTYGTASNPARPANITDFATNGLDSGYSLCFGAPCAGAAFPGINPNVGANQMLFPIGRSVYNGLQASLRQDVRNSFRGAKL